MAKPRTNRVIAARERGHAHIPERVNLPAPAARFSKVNSFCQG